MKQTIPLFLMLAMSFVAQAQNKSVYSASVWSPKYMTWTQTTLLTVRTVLPALEKARDLEEFCPGYAQAEVRAREICWLRIIGGLVKYESQFKPKDQFNGFDGVSLSVGLMSLAPGESAVAPTVELLKIPELNLQAGIEILARYVAEQGYISGPADALGGASYWSTLRAAYKVGDLNLGFRKEIIKLSSTYANF